MEEIEETEKKSEKKKHTWVWIVSAGLLAGLFIKLFVFEYLHVSGESMSPLIDDGETIYVNKLAYGLISPLGDRLLVQWSEPEKDDIVIYLYDDKIVVKRCVATAGDLLEYSFDNGYTLYVGEKAIPLTEIQYANLKKSQKVPEGYILAVGDNYAQSFDSRNYGFVSVKNILGKIICR